MRGRGTSSTRAKSDCAWRTMGAWRWPEARRRKHAASVSTQTFMQGELAFGMPMCERVRRGDVRAARSGFQGHPRPESTASALLLGKNGGVHVHAGAQYQAVGLVDQDLHRNALHHFDEVAGSVLRGEQAQAAAGGAGDGIH